jgi:membrane protease YdiL (CAAX protease family)
VIAFFALTFAISWTCFFGAAALVAPGRAFTDGLPGAIYLVGVFAPALTAIALAAGYAGRTAFASLVHRVIEAPSSVRLYVFAVLYTPAVKLSAAVLHRIALGAWPPFGSTPWYVMIAAVLLSTPAQAGEEIGWRGYALPRLAERFGLGRASLVLGVIWGLWHLPFFYIAGVDKTGQSLPVYVAGTTALSVAIAWLYWRANGSLLMTMLMHSAVNNTTDIVRTTTPGAAAVWSFHAAPIAWLTVAVMWTVATWALVDMRAASVTSFRTQRLFL